MRTIRVHDDEVGEIAFTYVTPIDDPINVSRRVRRLADNEFERQLASLHEIEEDEHGVLHERQTRRALEVGAGLLAGGVRRVIRCDDIEATVF